MSDRDYTELYASLQKETTILTAQIRTLYRELDKKFIFAGHRFQSLLDLKQMHWDPIQEPDIMKKNTSIFLCFLWDME